jgi:hypothetical protein
VGFCLLVYAGPARKEFWLAVVVVVVEGANGLSLRGTSFLGGRREGEGRGSWAWLMRGMSRVILRGSLALSISVHQTP